MGDGTISTCAWGVCVRSLVASAPGCSVRISTQNDDQVRSAVRPRWRKSSISIHLSSSFANCRLMISSFTQPSPIICPKFRRQDRIGESDASDFTADVSAKVARRALDAPRRGCPRACVRCSCPVATSVFAPDWSRLRDHGDHRLHFGAEAALARRPHCILRPYARSPFHTIGEV